MSDLRFDPISSSWVAIATNRRARPVEFIPLQEVRQQLICPFCLGNEDETPESISIYNGNGMDSATDSNGHWTVRVVPNKYPSLNEVCRDAAGGPFCSDQADGVQEIVIPSARHVASLSQLNDREIELTWIACRDRLKELHDLESIQHTMLFMNCGLAAGATLGHVHLQIIGSPIISPSLQQRSTADREHRQRTGIPLLHSVLQWELDQKKRIVEATRDWVVMCPYASRLAFQIWVVPRFDPGAFHTLNDKSLNQLGRILVKYVTHLEEILDRPAYNVLLHQSPRTDADPGPWYFEIFPRLTRLAGYELGTEIWINPVSPEAAARRLRSVVEP